MDLEKPYDLGATPNMFEKLASLGVVVFVMCNIEGTTPFERLSARLNATMYKNFLHNHVVGTIIQDSGGGYLHAT